MTFLPCRAITRRLGVTHLFLRPDGIHLRMDEKFLPDLGALYSAVAETDPRIAFNVRQPPEMVLRQSGLVSETALPFAISILTKVLSRTRELTDQHKVAGQSAGKPE